MKNLENGKICNCQNLILGIMPILNLKKKFCNSYNFNWKSPAFKIFKI